MTSTRDFDVIVIGGGHAGIEAALAAARMGAATACIVLDPEKIGLMSCNPAMGGIAKGQLIREIDALGGEIGLCTDETGIQFRMLNTRKGPAVRSPRAQCDRQAYNAAMVRRVRAQQGLEIMASEAVAIETCGEPGRERCVSGVRLADGGSLQAPAVILTTGTFLGAKLFAGEWESRGGRFGEAPSTRMASSLRGFGLRLGRHKTGTPPRLAADSIDYERLEEQPGDLEPRPFSFRTGTLDVDQISCWLTRTNPDTHRLIAENAERSAMFSGRIVGTGPRYCPSIEDKVMRFSDKDSHLLFLEPEGRGDPDVYPNGLSTSLPEDVQEKFLRTIEGLEEVRMVRPGHAVEYDYLCTDQIRADLSVASLEGLFSAGQINGTSGYEEAAGQGIIAGINAVRFVRGEPAFILDRATAYIGVMIDDLCRVNPREPYRMFTSRAEFRLLLRADNADRRLSPLGRELGLLGPEAHAAVVTKEERITAARELLARRRHQGHTLESILRRPEMSMADLLAQEPALDAMALTPEEVSEVEAEVKYEGYVRRQMRDVERMRRMEEKRIAPSIDYARIVGLSSESRELLQARRPLSLGEASRIPGVTPADLNLVLVAMNRSGRSDR